MSRNILIALWIAGGLFLAANIAVYYYQRHRFVAIITAWKQQDRTIAEKARLYDLEQELLKQTKAEQGKPEWQRILEAINQYRPDLVPTDNHGVIVYYKYK